MTDLVEWNSFYVIVGSSAGALMGLQFVVMTLIADMASSRVDTQASDAFATPSVVHFGVALLLSAVISAPWRGAETIAIIWGLVGCGGILYLMAVTRRMRRQSAYDPVFEDWLFHVLLPVATYATTLMSAFEAPSLPGLALYFVGASSLVFLFVGIHNAWDAVTYHVLIKRRGQQDRDSIH
jgi:hypothetical protein